MKKLSRHGVTLAYDEAGHGSPPVLLIHGWTCDHSHMSPQFKHFAKNRRTIAVDLRGHGESDKPKQDYTIAALASDVAWLCDRIEVTKPIVIGHSLGGLIALELGFRRKELPLAIVVLDSPIIPIEGRRPALLEFLEALRGPDYQSAQREFVSTRLFLATDDPKRKADIIRVMSASPRHVMVSVFENLLRWDRAAEVRACELPVAYIGAAQPLTDLVRLREPGSHWVIGQTVGTGHFLQLEAPDQVNAMIDLFLLTFESP